MRGFKLAINYSEDRFELGVGRRCKFKADLGTESRWSDEGQWKDLMEEFVDREVNILRREWTKGD